MKIVFRLTLKVLALYLEIRHPLLKGLGVVTQGALFFQEPGVPSVSCRLEQAVVVDVPERLAEGANNLLLGIPRCTVLVKLQTPLTFGQWESKGLFTPIVVQKHNCLIFFKKRTDVCMYVFF